MSPSDLSWLAAAIAALLVLQGLLWWCRRTWTQWRARVRGRKASRAERRAARLLQQAGFAIEAFQPTANWAVLVDGRHRPVELRADYLVRRGAERFVAEVKSGRVAPCLSTAATRRQLLEYRLAYAADGVLLVDMEHKCIHEVAFPLIDDPWG